MCHRKVVRLTDCWRPRLRLRRGLLLLIHLDDHVLRLRRRLLEMLHLDSHMPWRRRRRR